MTRINEILQAGGATEEEARVVRTALHTLGRVATDEMTDGMPGLFKEVYEDLITGSSLLLSEAT